MPQKWPEQKHRDLIAGLQDGLSCREAARRVGVSPATAIRWAHRAGAAPTPLRRISPEIRTALRAALAAGASPSEAAIRFCVSRSTAVRLAPPQDARRREAREALSAALAQGLSRRRAADALGLSVATAIRWARQWDLAPSQEPPRTSKVRPPRYRRDRETKRAQLLTEIATGMSKRQAAAKLGLPVATAIRWARDPSRK